MTTATDLITAGFREGNLIPVGQTPTTAEQTEALSVLNRYLRNVFGYVIGENLRDWQVPTVQRTGSVEANAPLLPGSRATRYTPNSAYPPPNTRIVWDGSTQTVYFPEAPVDGARMALIKGSGAAAASAGTLTLNGNGRTIEGANTYTTTTGTARKWLYRADTANWVALTTLALTDDCPFPDEFDDYWTTAIAIRLAPRYGRQIAAETAKIFTRTESKIRAQYFQPTPAKSGGQDLINSEQSYDYGWFDRI